MLQLNLLLAALPVVTGNNQFGATIAVVGDVDGDHIADWAASDPFEPGVVQMRSGKSGTLIWSSPSPGERLGWGYALSAVGDCNEDGIDDLAVTSSHAQGESPQLAILSGKDGTRLVALPRRGPGRFIDAVCGTVDLDRDAKSDLLIVELELRGGFGIVSLEAWGSAKGTRLWTTERPGLAGIGAPFASGIDFTGDGVADVAARTRRVLSHDVELRIALVSGADGRRVESWSQPSDRAFVDVDVMSRRSGTPLVIAASAARGESKAVARLDAFRRAHVEPLWSFEIPEAIGAIDLALCSRHDLTGDGIGDVVVGQRLANLASGRIDAFDGASHERLWSLENSEGEDFGYAVEPHPDLDGDGIGDFIVASACPNFGGNEGAVVAVSGKSGREVYRVHRDDAKPAKNR